MYRSSTRRLAGKRPLFPSRSPSSFEIRPFSCFTSWTASVCPTLPGPAIIELRPGAQVAKPRAPGRLHVRPTRVSHPQPAGAACDRRPARRPERLMTLDQAVALSLLDDLSRVD